MGFKPYKKKKARTSPEKSPIFKEPLPVVEILARLVREGRITQECADEALLVRSGESFMEFNKKWLGIDIALRDRRIRL